MNEAQFGTTSLWIVVESLQADVLLSILNEIGYYFNFTTVNVMLKIIMRYSGYQPNARCYTFWQFATYTFSKDLPVAGPQSYSN